MAKTNAWENALLQLLFNNITATGIGDITGLVGSGVAGSLYLSLHSDDPTVDGDQTSNEVNYTGYTRIPVARTTGGWIISGSSPTQVANTVIVFFPRCSGGFSLATYVGVGTSLSGAGLLLYSGILGSSLEITNNVTPTFNPSSLIITES